MRKKTVLAVLIGCILIAVGLMLLTEGGLRISTITYEELSQYEMEEMPDGLPAVVAVSPEKDAVISVFTDGNNGIYILEFSRSLILDRYSLVEKHHYTESGQTFNSVVSTAVSHYAYCVDPSGPSVEIYEGDPTGAAWNWIAMILLGILIIFQAAKPDKQKN